jgi:hypothetical protein
VPFKSEAQRAWMHINEPEMAKRWEKHTPKGKKLPKRVKKKKTRKEEFEYQIDLALKILMEEETEVDFGQSSKHTKLGATTGVNKTNRPKHKRKNAKNSSIPGISKSKK